MDIEDPKHAIGKGTKEAIQAGVVYGFAGQVDGLVGRLRDELGEEATAIATGGFAQAIVPFCDQIDEIDDLLTLTGSQVDLGAKPRLIYPAAIRASASASTPPASDSRPSTRPGSASRPK